MRQALEAAGLWPQPVLCAPSPVLASREETVTAFLRQARPPVAMVAYDDMSAVAALRAAHQAGWRVPDDLSVVGIDDIQFAAYTNPGLTTVAQPKQDLGSLAVDALLAKADDPPPARVLDGQLVVRQSTARPPAATESAAAHPSAGQPTAAPITPAVPHQTRRPGAQPSEAGPMTSSMQSIDVDHGPGWRRPAGMRAIALRRLRRDPVALFAFGLLVLLILGALIGGPLAAHLTGHGPDQQFPNALASDSQPLGLMQRAYLPNGTTHNPHGSLFILGSDELGRDVLVRVLYGARISLLVATSATALAVIIGVTLGLVAGYFGGWIDAVVNRMTETAMAFPNLLLAVGLAVVVGPGLLNVVIIIALFTWYYPARIVRGTTVATRQMTFVAAARTVGARPRRILFVHLLPQVWGPLLVYATSIIANNIIFEAGLSYLGVGVPPPTPSWGQMLSDAVTSGMYQTDITLALAPGLALVITMLAFNLAGDGLRDALAPGGR